MKCNFFLYIYLIILINYLFIYTFISFYKIVLKFMALSKNLEATKNRWRIENEKKKILIKIFHCIF